MEYVVDNFIIGPSQVSVSDLTKGGEKNHKLALLKGEESILGGQMNLYKSESSMVDELESLQSLTPKELQMKSFFAKGRNYFIQVVGVEDQHELLLPLDDASAFTSEEEEKEKFVQ